MFVLRVKGDGRPLWVRCDRALWTLVADRALATRWSSGAACHLALSAAPGPIRVQAEREEVVDE